MLKKNIEKKERKDKPTWEGYYPRVVQDKTRYSRKVKHKERNFSKEYC